MALALLKTDKEFYGRNIEEMPKLIIEGRTPLTVQGLIQRRLQVIDSQNQSLIDSYWNNYFDTGDALLQHPNGNIKVVLDSSYLRNITPKSKLFHGGLVLTPNEYVRLDVPEFVARDLERYTRKSWRATQVTDNPIWLTLARDPKLLKEYTTKMFALTKEKYNINEIMRIYLSPVQERPILRSAFVRRLYDRSDVDGFTNIDSDDGRLLGVEAQEEQSIKRSLEERLESSKL